MSSRPASHPAPAPAKQKPTQPSHETRLYVKPKGSDDPAKRVPLSDFLAKKPEAVVIDGVKHPTKPSKK